MRVAEVLSPPLVKEERASDMAEALSRPVLVSWLPGLVISLQVSVDCGFPH